MGRVVGKRGGLEALIEVLNKTGIVTFSLVIIKHFMRRNLGEFPILGVSPLNDIIISRKRHVLAPKIPKTRCARDFS